MNIPVAKKVAMLKEFHTYLYQRDWRFMESSEKDKAVLEEFSVVRTFSASPHTHTHIRIMYSTV